MAARIHFTVEELTNFCEENVKLEEDDKLNTAMKLAIKSGSCTPLIKEELNTKIKLRRLLEGQNDITVLFSQPKIHKLRPDEEEKRRRRREQNRVAAEKARRKRKRAINDMIRKNSEMESKNVALGNLICQLQKEKEHMKFMFAQHVTSCVV